MFKGAYQRKLLTVLYSGGSNPLEIWDIQVKNGWTRRVKDEDMSTIVFEICGTNVATAYICSPPDPRGALAITLPFITMIIKNLKRYFTFEIQILDDKQMRRRFRFSNYQSSTKVRPFTCSVPLALKPGWNQMQLNLANFTMRAYGTNYLETQRVQIHANCRIRRIYFSDRLYAEEELPKEYRIFLNLRQAPQPPPEPEQPQPQPSRASLGKKLSEVKVPTITKGPPSILKTHSMLKSSENSEEEMTKTSFKSSLSAAERISLKEFTETVTQAQESQPEPDIEPAPYERGVTFHTGSKTSLKVGSKVSLASATRGSIAREGSLARVESLKMGEGEDQVPAEETMPPGDVVEPVEAAEEGGEVESPLPEQGPAQELSEIPEESTEVESPVETESEFAESEPIPDSDLEEKPSSPEPDIDSP